jgi:hypothetical protein
VRDLARTHEVALKDLREAAARATGAEPAKSTAFAIALTKRLCTFYLPPIWGYPALQWLRRTGYV